MSFQTPITIFSAIENIRANRYLLPAIQREFVWSHEKIEWLFDSIMRNYPISSFLFWQVKGENKKNYKFYKFLDNFKQRYQTHNQEFMIFNHNDFTAVLDGQQRLTSLYIGLCGSYAYRTPRLHEENTERVYPTRRLYLNIEKPLEDEEDGRVFEFKFLTENEFKSNEKAWFLVSNIMNHSNAATFYRYIIEHKLLKNQFACDTLSIFRDVIHTKPIINFFLETEQDLDKALNIFIRINSGGEPLNFSDLMMSIAVANWDKTDARQQIHSLVDSVRDKGFLISKDFILKTFLYLHSSDIRFKITNFSKENVVKFEGNWKNIRDAILSVFDLVKSFGFSDLTLTSKNALIPIVFYIYHRNIFCNFHTSVGYENDREIIKKWLHVILIKKVFSTASDGVLSQIRKAFTDNILNPVIIQGFPAGKIQIRNDMGISDDFISEILLTQKDDKYAFSILALIYPNLDYKNNNFHKDHIHPANKFNKEEHEWKTYNSILNLQMLDANENMSKQDFDLSDWVLKKTDTDSRKSFLENHLIPADVDLTLDKFDDFIEARRKILSEQLRKILA